MVVCDEAHCISLWGWDFRKSYFRIPHLVDFINTQQNVRPIVAAFTATATEEVKEETTTEEVKEETTTEADASKSSKKKNKSKKNKTAKKDVTFVINKGMYSEELAVMLQNYGIIEDAHKFNQYLCNNNNYAKKLKPGTYTVKQGADYATIASKVSY